MMDWTDRHCRFFHRLITRHARLYSEMITAEAILRGRREMLLAFSPQEHPVVLATASGAHAMGVYSPEQPSRGFETLGYGRFRFAAEKVVKWNCVFRVRDAAGIRPGDYRFRMFVPVGTLADVRKSLQSLAAEFPAGR